MQGMAERTSNLASVQAQDSRILCATDPASTLALPPAAWVDAGLWPYPDMLHLQQRLNRARQLDRIPDTILILQHTACVTIGRSGSRQHVLAPAQVLEQAGISVHQTDRGGDVTYHGPGQLVCYPILSLRRHGQDLHRFARNMEDVLLRTLAHFDISAGRKTGYPGVWTAQGKIGALGMAVRRWVTMHGVSLNVCPDMTHFDMIVPCGLSGQPVTSMTEMLGTRPELAAVAEAMRTAVAEIFDLDLQSTSLSTLTRELSHAETILADHSGPQS